jgi:hypothetical protein
MSITFCLFKFNFLNCAERIRWVVLADFILESMEIEKNFMNLGHVLS